MSEPSKVVDVSAALGVKVMFKDVPAQKLLDRPVTAEAHFSPGANSFRHIHPIQDESFQVLSGTLDVFLDNKWHKLGPGQAVTIPRGTVHGWRNSTNEITKAINTHNPGLRFQEYLEGMQRLIQQRKITSRTGFTSGIYLSLHSLEFRDDVVAIQPPFWFIKLMARIGRLLGHKL